MFAGSAILAKSFSGQAKQCLPSGSVCSTISTREGSSICLFFICSVTKSTKITLLWNGNYLPRAPSGADAAANWNPGRCVPVGDESVNLFRLFFRMQRASSDTVQTFSDRSHSGHVIMVLLTDRVILLSCLRSESRKNFTGVGTCSGPGCTDQFGHAGHAGHAGLFVQHFERSCATSSTFVARVRGATAQTAQGVH